MKSIDLAKRLEGLHTIKTIQKELKIARSTAIKLMCFLRKQGFVETSGGGKQPRFYRISPIKVKKAGYPGLYDMINKYSPIKIAEPVKHRIMGKRISVEEALVRAVETGKFRVILASLALFRHIKNWSRLYEIAKQHNVRRKVGALYDLARLFIKVRRMDKKTENNLLSSKDKDKYIIPEMSSEDFADIQKKWKIYIPFTRYDLRRYKE
ncbi:hypothetical protein KY361_03005 [Candidatus Woesearchaeota archaeon]|nr:hypothetical protein [Candidatus Woesearchaeota archaeon]